MEVRCPVQDRNESEKFRKEIRTYQEGVGEPSQAKAVQEGAQKQFLIEEAAQG